MLNRRFLRVKALQEIYAYHQSNSSDIPQSERHLLQGVDELYKLFIYQVTFWTEVRQFAIRRIEENKQKHFPTEEDLNPNMKFVNNRILTALEDNKHLELLRQQYKIDWTDSREDFIRNMFVKMTELPEYQEYMSNGKDSFADDKKFLVTVIENYTACCMITIRTATCRSTATTRLPSICFGSSSMICLPVSMLSLLCHLFTIPRKRIRPL